MTKIVVPDARTLLGQTREENQRLREERNAARMTAELANERARRTDEELAKVLEVNAEQAKHIERLLEEKRQAQQRERARMVRSGE